MNRKAYRFFLFALAVTVLLAISAWQGWKSYMNTPMDVLAEERIVYVASGSSFSRFAQEMAEKGLWRYPRAMVWYVRLFEPAFLLKAGEYRIPATATPGNMLDLLNSGKVVQHQITFIEGDTLADILQRMHENPVLVKTITASGKPLGGELFEGIENLEGWILPETWYFKKGDSDLDLLLRAYREMRKVLQEEWDNRAQDLPYNSAYEALIMASLIEKETGVPEEREQIAGVFVRRLQKGMRLQTDPTVIYGMGERYQGNISKQDLRADNPYNTYTRSGLPPTPIAMPGRAAIYAALHPAPGEALYFVAKGDGSHHFSATLEEHQQAVRRYQVLQRRVDYQSSPPPARSNGRG